MMMISTLGSKFSKVVSIESLLAFESYFGRLVPLFIKKKKKRQKYPSFSLPNPRAFLYN